MAEGAGRGLNRRDCIRLTIPAQSAGGSSAGCGLAAGAGHDGGQRTRWQRGQKWDERFMKLTRTIGRPQRAHGCPVRP